MLTNELAQAPNNLESYWIPFTPNKSFKAEPRLISRARDMHFTSTDGREILDATAGLWCCNAGHCRPSIVKAVQEQIADLDFAPSFQFSHPKAFELASRLANLMPGSLDYAFFTNSGSESVDTALKMALAYHRARGEGTRTRFIGRDRGYHGVGFGGISVGGMVGNRKWFGQGLGGIDHLPHTHSIEHNAFSRGQPAWGAHLADELENLIALHDASNIAAVIVEPVAGSIGVYPPAEGYLEKLRAITKKHGILLIFDEVITAYGRLGKGSAAEYFGVEPDLMTTAKGLTSGVIPMGAVIAAKHIYDGIVGAQTDEKVIELFHGYTYSAHPVACAAALATLDLYRDEGLFEHVAELAPYWEEGLHSLKGRNHIIDIRNIGLMGAIELASRPDGKPGHRAYDAMRKGFHEYDIMLRITGDTLALSPPLIVSKSQIDEIIDKVGTIIDQLD